MDRLPRIRRYRHQSSLRLPWHLFDVTLNSPANPIFLPLSSYTITMAPDSMRAVVFKEVRKVEVEQRPVPKIQDPQDVIVKVRYTALCGR